LAGGVAAGTAGEMMLTPFGSMIVGFLAGIISVLGFKYLSVFPDVADGVRDTSYQGAMQAASIAVTLGIALFGGLVVGFILKLPIRF
ncbi:hypothetical protein GOODEAATRI_015368, partial [Goodea atripinnis]